MTRHSLFKTLGIFFFVLKFVDSIHVMIKEKYYSRAMVHYPEFYYWLALLAPVLAILFLALANATTQNVKAKSMFKIMILVMVMLFIIDIAPLAGLFVIK